MKTLKSIIFCTGLVSAAMVATPQSFYFPPVADNHWETLSPVVLGWDTSEIDPLVDFLEENQTRAFLLLKDGKIVLEKYFHGFHRDSVWYWASAGKTLVSFLVGMAQQEGHLTIDDSSSEYLGTGWTNCPEDEERKITIRHQLTMSTGLNDKVENNHCTLDTCLLCLTEPGRRWAYHNAPYTLLEQVLNKATGISLNNYLFQKLSIHTGISGLFINLGYNNVIFSKPTSMARFGLLMLNNGNWNGKQLLTDSAYFHQMMTPSQSQNESYGYLWWLNGKSSFMVPGFQHIFKGMMFPNAPPDMYAALGKNGQILNVVPQQRIVMVRMGNFVDDRDVSITLNDQIWEYLNQIMNNPNSTGRDHLTVNELKIYPNPAAGMFIHLGIPEKFNLTYGTLAVYDLSGNLVMKADTFQRVMLLDINTLRPATYVIRVWNDRQSMTGKFTVLN